jgi:hypothetical protein
MKLLVVIGLSLGVSAIGCGPGLSHRAKAPVDVFGAMDAELAHAISTTTLTSAAVAQPNAPQKAPLPVATWEDDADEASPPPMQTWGTPPEPIPSTRE